MTDKARMVIQFLGPCCPTPTRFWNLSLLSFSWCPLVLCPLLEHPALPSPLQSVL